MRKRLLAVSCFIFVLLLSSCSLPKEDIQLRQVRDVVADATSEPTLKATAVLFNPNNVAGKLKGINVDIYVNGKKAGTVNRKYKIKIPANSEFTVPLEVKLDLAEFGSLSTILSMVGGKKFDVQYVGKLKVSYRGVPIGVPIDHKSQIRLSF